MKLKLFLFCFFIGVFAFFSQTPTDYLSKKFHKNRREAVRSKMAKNSVAVIFSNPLRNRANDVDYVFHQDPNFYYLTGFREPNAVLVLFAEDFKDRDGNSYNELIYVPVKSPVKEMWNGKRLGVAGAKKQLGFKNAKTTDDFISNIIDFKQFDAIYIENFKNDYRNSNKNTADLFDLINVFKQKTDYNPDLFLSTEQKKVYELIKATPIENAANVAQVVGRAITYYPALEDDAIITGYTSATDKTSKLEFKAKATAILNKKSTINIEFLPVLMGKMREIKTEEELRLLTKAIRISAVGQIEVMKAMKPHMSETEIQGIHEFVYKKYGAEYEGYPSIVGAGNNGCILHYIDNAKEKVDHDLVLMDLGAEYRGYTADVTRTIPANGKFNSAQKAIYELVLKAQNAGIEACKVGNPFWEPHKKAKEIINTGLADLGIITSANTKHQYFPHGTSHYLGLDVHDPGTYENLKENSVITVEPGIYIPKGSPCDKKWWDIAVRIEDDILITNNGAKNLSEEAPRTIEAIEAMMAKKSVLDEFVLPNLDK